MSSFSHAQDYGSVGQPCLNSPVRVSDIGNPTWPDDGILCAARIPGGVVAGEDKRRSAVVPTFDLVSVEVFLDGFIRHEHGEPPV